MNSIQRRSLYMVAVTENKGKGWLIGKQDYNDTVKAYAVADSEKQARKVAIKSLVKQGLLDNVKKIINVHVEIERELVVLEV